MPIKEAKGDIVIAINFIVQEAVQQLYIVEYFCFKEANAFKRRIGFSFTINLKPNDIGLWKNFMCPLAMSPYSRNFLVTLLYIYSITST